jgi:lipoyl(octanoyl) transferase
LNLPEIRRDVAWYVRSLEEAMIRATSEFGVASRRVSGRTGVWVDVQAGRTMDDRKEVKEGKHVEEGKYEEKLAAIGVHLSRWVTSHGFAYNVSTDLRYFDLIVPCGIAGKRATSLEKLLTRRVEIKEAAPRVASHLGDIFGLDPRACGRDNLDSILSTTESQLVGTSA